MLLDFDADGLKLSSVAGGVTFDLDVDGRRERVGWTARDAEDGFLVVDRNSNGRVDDGSELIGNRFPTAGGKTWPTGLRALIVLQDGVKIGPDGRALPPLPAGVGEIDEADSIYGRLLVWIDRNHDGASQAQELRQLRDSSIAGIKTGMRGMKLVKQGNEIFMTGSFFVLQRGVRFPRPISEVRLAR